MSNSACNFPPILRAIVDKNIDDKRSGFKALLKSAGIELPEKIFPNREEFFSYIKSLNLKEILGLDRTCPFHGGDSFNVFKHSKDNVYLCYCHSEKCKYHMKTMSIIELVQELQQSTLSEAIRFLKRALNCTYTDKTPELNSTNPKSGQILDKNIEILCSFDNYCPTVYKELGRDIEILQCLYNIAKRQIGDYTTSNPWVMISISSEFIKSELGINRSITSAMAMLAYFGLIRKVPLYEITTEKLLKLKGYKEKEKREKYVSQIQIYELTEDKLLEIEENAKRWQEYGYTKNGLTYSIIRAREGWYKAHEIFPQRTIDDESNAKFMELEQDIYDIILNSAGGISVADCKDKLLALTITTDNDSNKDYIDIDDIKPKYTKTYITNTFSAALIYSEKKLNCRIVHKNRTPYITKDVVGV